ncbi:hypothetical protein J2128_000303 [Methanomicrobium sp. W14]|uniref:hypothetical protein n=1 Tax=Methanomicrobium sp. W14 TaxID=2817839 RepID=UPI001AE88166|nr:hypothetical protein [Methanomicrobium sp. W14]MBP2132382.1 hypothetical protein [Methanomicrobium sp. W14]
MYDRLSVFSTDSAWNTILNLTGTDNSSAVLDQVYIKTFSNGTIDSFNLYFYGQNGTQNKWYRIEGGCGRSLDWDSANISDSPEGVHPLTLLNEIGRIHEIGRIPYDRLACKDKGIVISVDSQSGNMEYDSAYERIFLVDEGNLTPVKKVIFHTAEPVYVISVCCRYNSSSPERSEILPDIENSCIALFTNTDLGKAEVVEY